MRGGLCRRVLSGTGVWLFERGVETFLIGLVYRVGRGGWTGWLDEVVAFGVGCALGLVMNTWCEQHRDG